MISNKIIRLISTNKALWQADNKSLLAKLRKKTGYTFANCKKALELHENDLQKVYNLTNYEFIDRGIRTNLSSIFRQSYG